MYLNQYWAALYLAWAFMGQGRWVLAHLHFSLIGCYQLLDSVMGQYNEFKSTTLSSITHIKGRVSMSNISNNAYYLLPGTQMTN